jgi:hypothetical protein
MGTHTLDCCDPERKPLGLALPLARASPEIPPLGHRAPRLDDFAGEIEELTGGRQIAGHGRRRY